MGTISKGKEGLAPCNLDREDATFWGGLIFDVWCEDNLPRVSGILWKLPYPGFLAYCGDTLSFLLLTWPGAHFFSEGAEVEHVALMFVSPGSHIQGTSQNSDVPCSRMLSSPFSHSFWTVWVHEYPSQVSLA